MSYNTLSAQEAFLNLPEDDKDILLAHHYELAHKIEATGNAINTTIEGKLEAKETTANTVELDNENYGAPPENSGIVINPKNASYTEPQAWEYQNGRWLYNFPGAVQLAKVLGRTLPNIDQLVAAINKSPDNFGGRAAIRYGRTGEINVYHYYPRMNFGNSDERNDYRFSNFWSSSEGGSLSEYAAELERGKIYARRKSTNRHHGIFVRFILDKK